MVPHAYQHSLSAWANRDFLAHVGALLRSKEPKPPERLYSLLCVCCCVELLVAYSIFAEEAQAFLNTELKRGIVSEVEVSVLLARLKYRGAYHDVANEVGLAVFINPRLASTAPNQAEARTIAKLVKGFG